MARSLRGGRWNRRSHSYQKYFDNAGIRMLETISNSLDVDFSALDNLFEDRGIDRPTAVVGTVIETEVAARFTDRLGVAASTATVAAAVAVDEVPAPVLAIEEDWNAHDWGSLTTLFRRSVATTLPFIFSDLLALSLSGLLPYAMLRLLHVAGPDAAPWGAIG